jgi:hypothetical protein
MEHTDNIIPAMVREIKSGAATVAQDLSKGVVPVVLVIALLAPTWYLRGKLSDVEHQLSNNAVATDGLTKKLEELGPLVHDVALAQAQIQTHAKSLEIAERDKTLLDSRLRDLEKRLQRIEIARERE